MAAITGFYLHGPGLESESHTEAAPSNAVIDAPQHASSRILSGIPRNLGEVSRRIQELGSLHENWDGQGAAAVTAEAVDLAIETLWSVSQRAVRDGLSLPVPVASPSPDGSIGLELHTSNGEITIECTADGQLTAYANLRGREEERAGISFENLWEMTRPLLADG